MERVDPDPTQWVAIDTEQAETREVINDADLPTEDIYPLGETDPLPRLAEVWFELMRRPMQ